MNAMKLYELYGNLQFLQLLKHPNNPFSHCPASAWPLPSPSPSPHPSSFPILDDDNCKLCKKVDLFQPSFDWLLMTNGGLIFLLPIDK